MLISRSRLCRIAAAAAICLTASRSALADDRRFDLKLPPDSLISSLKQLHTQTDGQVVYSPVQLEGVTASGLSGAFTLSEALTRLLQGTGFTYKIDERGTIVVVPVPISVVETPPPPSRIEPPPIEEITVTAEKRQ